MEYIGIQEENGGVVEALQQGHFIWADPGGH